MTPAPPRLRALVALPLLASLVLAGAAQARAPKLGPNLVPNASFEQSSLDPATQNGLPVTPVAWSFEGAGYPDYNQAGGHTGAHNVKISTSLGGGTQLCDASAAVVTNASTCVPNPAYPGTHALDEATQATSSMRPVWVSDAPIPVVAGKRYRFSVWALRPTLGPDLGVMGEGAQTRVRWVDASGLGVGVSKGASLVRGPKRTLGFKLISADLTVPAGAVGAVLMLGHTDYMHTGAQVAFDDVSFQALS